MVNEDEPSTETTPPGNPTWPGVAVESLLRSPPPYLLLVASSLRTNPSQQIADTPRPAWTPEQERKAKCDTRTNSYTGDVAPTFPPLAIAAPLPALHISPPLAATGVVAPCCPIVPIPPALQSRCATRSISLLIFRSLSPSLARDTHYSTPTINGIAIAPNPVNGTA